MLLFILKLVEYFVAVRRMLKNDTVQIDALDVDGCTAVLLGKLFYDIE
jgi:hypothetical protein